MLRILGKSTSINVRKVLWACAELSIAYEFENLGSQEHDLRDAAFLALNPNAHYERLSQRKGFFQHGRNGIP